MNNDLSSTEPTVSKSDFIEHFVKKLRFRKTKECVFNYFILLITLSSVILCFLIATSNPGGSWITLDFRAGFGEMWNLVILLVTAIIGFSCFISKKHQLAIFTFYSSVIGAILNEFIIWYYQYLRNKYIGDLLLLGYIIIFMVVFTVIIMINIKITTLYNNIDNLILVKSIKFKCINFMILIISYLIQFYFYYIISNNNTIRLITFIFSILIILLNLVSIIFFISKKQFLSIIQMLSISGYAILLFFTQIF